MANRHPTARFSNQSHRTYLLRLECLEERAVPAGFRPMFVPVGLNPEGGSSPSGYSPSQITGAYADNNIMFGNVVGNGAGQTIALVDAYNDPDIQHDLAAFDSNYGLPAPPSFTVVNQTGGSVLPGTDPSGEWAVEESLDVEWAHVIAPGANLVLVESANSSGALLVAAAAAADLPGVSVVSMSWGEPEIKGETSYDNSLFVTPPGHNPVTFFASSGDSGGGQIIYPSLSPNVVSVGGTSLNISGTSYGSESAWSGSGGGISSYESQPSYQQGMVPASMTTTRRTDPDVSMDADPYTGVPVYDSYNFGASTPWAQYGGTSLSSPMWAAVVAIADQGRVLAGEQTLNGISGTLPALYQMPSADYHDITSGSNGYSAIPGYDLATGIGTPIVNNLVPYLATVATSGVSTSSTILTSVASLQTLTNFTSPASQGQQPTGTLISDATGDLYGTDSVGGSAYDGTIFELVKGSSGYTNSTLATFTGANGNDPSGELAIDGDGDIFGTTVYGGSSNEGTVFELVKGSGGYTLSTLSSFTGANGSTPLSGVMIDGDGDLFGTTLYGGSSSEGVVFELVKKGGNYTDSTLENFNKTNGSYPEAGLAIEGDGDLFGTTFYGGSSNDGVVYELVPGSGGSYSLSTLTTFTGSNGSNPQGGLLIEGDGDVIGTTAYGGTSGDGTVFELVPGSGGYSLANLANFNGTNGALPNGGLISDSQGDLLGTTYLGGSADEGSAFEMVPNSNGYSLYTLANFDRVDGALPEGGLTADGQGDFFGTVYSGGNSQGGSVFEVTPAVYGLPLTMSAAVFPTPGGVTPTGSVTFSDNSTTLGSASLANGIATFTMASLTAGVHSISAAYGGDGHFTSNTSSSNQLYVAQAASGTVVSTSSNPSSYGATITFTATISESPTGSGIPTGSATFYDGSVPLATETLINGIATFSTSSLAAGSHSISVVYSGDSNFHASTSPAISQVVNAALPAVSSVVINPGEGAPNSDTYLGNSRVLSIQVTFSTPIDNTPALQNAFSLTRSGLTDGVAGDNATIGAISISTSTNGSGDTVATLTFSGANTEGGSLADGNWTLNINAADVTSGGVPMAADYTQTGILRLFGDYDGTGTVDSTDLGVMGTTFGLGSANSGYIAAFDSDGNGQIDSVDLSRFGTNFGLTV